MTAKDERADRWVIRVHQAREAVMVDFISAKGGLYVFEDVNTKERLELAFGTFAVLTTGKAGDMGKVIEQPVLL
jgi:hypothetical protein